MGMLWLKILNNKTLGCGLGFSLSGQGPLASSYEQGIKISGTINCEVIFDRLRIVYILKKDSAPWS